MNIAAHTENNTKYIYLLGNLESEAEKKKFIVELYSNSKTEVILNQREVVDSFILTELSRVQRLGSMFNVKVKTESKLLCSYLNSFKINCINTSKIGFTKESEVVITSKNISKLMKFIHDKYHYDLHDYSEELLKRTTKRFMVMNGISTFNNLLLNLDDVELFMGYFNDFAISVTSFFRNEKTWKYVVDEVFPYLETFPQIRIWSAGCSTGEEPFSLAILLQEHGLLDKSIIYATDYNMANLTVAKNNAIPLSKLKDSVERYNVCGERDLLDYFSINEEIATLREDIFSKVQFFNHNLLTDSSFNEFHMVICKNVLIYFDKNAQVKVIDLFNSSLHRGGYLVSSDSEEISLIDKGNFSKTHSLINVYRKNLRNPL